MSYSLLLAAVKIKSGRNRNMTIGGRKETEISCRKKAIALRIKIMKSCSECDRLLQKTEDLVDKIYVLEKEQLSLTLRTGKAEEDAIGLINQAEEISKQKKKLGKEAEETLKEYDRVWEKRVSLELERAPLEEELRKYLKRIRSN
jgi:hypothetical protein